jgi:hypothetical protein
MILSNTIEISFSVTGDIPYKSFLEFVVGNQNPDLRQAQKCGR